LQNPFPPAKAAKVTPFAAVDQGDVRRNRFPDAPSAKTTLFAGGRRSNVRQNRFLRFWPNQQG
jgi:hypothetical protein